VASLSAEMIQFLGAGVTHQVGACDRGGRPSICRALAATVDEQGQVVVLISAQAGFEVLAAIRDTRRVSAVFACPGDFRALHVKGQDAVVGHADEAYRTLVAERRLAIHAQLGPYGFSEEFMSAWYTVPDEELAYIRFTPLGAWNQTPGPGAGGAVELAA
jgi:hypothetical protein